MTEKQVKICTALKDKGWITRREISECIYGKGAEQSIIYSALEALTNVGVVVKKGKHPTLYSLFDSSNTYISPKEMKKDKEITTVELNANELKKAYDKVIEDKTYGQELQLVNSIFNTPQYKLNKDVNIVAMKIALIDVTNSTHLHQHKKNISLSELAQYIVNNIPDFDERVQKRDDSLVTQLANASGDIALFSFASKYCHYHNSLIYGRDDYAKFDTVVRRCLPHYLKKYNITLNGRTVTEATLNDMRAKCDYKSFNCLIDLVLKDIEHPFKKRDFDYIMWYYNR